MKSLSWWFSSFNIVVDGVQFILCSCTLYSVPGVPNQGVAAPMVSFAYSILWGRGDEMKYQYYYTKIPINRLLSSA